LTAQNLTIDTSAAIRLEFYLRGNNSGQYSLGEYRSNSALATLVVCGNEQVSASSSSYENLSIQNTDVALTSYFYIESTDLLESTTDSWFIKSLDTSTSHDDCYATKTYSLCKSISSTGDSCEESWYDIINMNSGSQCSGLSSKARA
jgi:hypothetical protein